MGIRCLSFSPDGALVATAGQDGLLRLWSTESAGLIGQPMQHDSFVDWAGFTPDGQRLISTSNLIARIHIWDPGMGQEVVPSIDTGGKLWVTPPAISGDGQRIIAGVAFATTGNTLDHFRCSIQMWAIQNGQRLFASSPWFGYSGYGFSVDGRYVAGGSMPASEIAVLNLTSGKEVRRPGLDDDLCNVAFEPQSRFFAGTIKRRAFLWSTDTAEQICGPLDHAGNVEQLLISPNGQVMACSTRSSISFWSIPEGRRLGDPIPFRCGGYHGMRFFPDGRHLAAFGERSKTVCFWDSATGNQFATPLVHDDPVARFAISPNGRLIATVTAKEPKTALGESAAFIWSLKADLLAVWPSRTSASELTEMERQLKTAGINDCDRAAMEILKILAQNT
jgi:WD40 repeat protein